jgi:5-methylcytosine-specific restriction endonuclease McrA
MIRPRRTLRRGELTREEKAAIRHGVFVRDGGRCVDCGTRVVEESGLWWSMHLMHIRSRGAGGTWDMPNLVTGCLFCHQKRHNAGGKPCPPKSRVP